MVHWVDLSDGRRGLACTSDAAGGYDALGARLRLTALRSPRVSDHGRGWANDDPAAYPITDQGRHQMRFRLTPHLGTWADAQVARMADEHRVELPVVLDTWHHGRLGSEASALEVKGDGVVVPVVKRAETGAGTVLRVWEVGGRRSQARVTLPLQDRSWEGDLGPHRSRTLFVSDDPEVPVRYLDIPELELGVQSAVIFTRGRCWTAMRSLPVQFTSLFERHPELWPVAAQLDAAFDLLVRTFEAGGTVYVGGNGGSAADAEHIVGELMKGMERRRPVTANYPQCPRRGCAPRPR